MRAMQLQHAKQVAKMRQEMQLTAQQMAERDRLHMHEFREQQVELYRRHTQAIEDRKSAHIQVCTPCPHDMCSRGRERWRTSCHMQASEEHRPFLGQTVWLCGGLSGCLCVKAVLGVNA